MDFAATIQKITSIEPHPDADRLEIAHVLGYQCVVRKGNFEAGETIVYIPEKSLVPMWVQEKVGCVGYLAGSEKNRVKPIRLRGVLSQGLISKNFTSHEEIGFDVTEELEIVKYTPPIPPQLAGDVWHAGSLIKSEFCVTNLKNVPDRIPHGENVFITEKIHGTFCQIVVEDGEIVAISSKGLGNKELALKESDTNTYWRAARKFLDLSKIHGKVRIYGEVYGNGIQDLSYGTDFGFRCFDIQIGDDWLNGFDLFDKIAEYGLEAPTLLFSGPFDLTLVKELATGTESISGSGCNLREGVVIRRDRRPPERLFKYISPAYLMRKGGTEYN